MENKKYIAVPLIVAVSLGLLFAYSAYNWQIASADAASWKSQFYSKSNEYDELAKDLEDREGQIHNLSATYTNLESQLGDLQRQIGSLNSQNAILLDQKNILQAQINVLQTQIDGLEVQIDDLRDPHLVKVNFLWSDNHPWYSTWYVNIKGTVFNSGYRTATDVVMQVKVYDNGVLIREAFIDLNEVYSQWYINIDVNVLYYSGDATSVEIDFTYTHA